MEIKDLIRKYRLRNNLTQDDLAEKMGTVKGVISQWEGGKRNPGIESIKNLSNIFGVDLRAEMANYGVVNEPEVIYGKPLLNISHDPNGRKIPAFEGQAFATISPAMGDVVTLRPDTFVRIPMFSQGEFAVQVTGHSMKPYISHGDWAVIKRITNRDAVIYGEPYLIITKSDQLKTVKFLKAGDEPDTFWLVPYNVEQFEPQEIDKTEVLELYRVVGIFRTV